MAIYARFGGEVKIVAARMIPVWIVQSKGAIRWHYSKPTKLPRDAKVEEQPIWHYRGYWRDTSNPVCDGLWNSANDLKADDGWKEIEAALLEHAPESKAKFEAWNRADAPEASHFFEPIGAKEAA